MSPEQAAWLGAVFAVVLVGARWLCHYLLCNCSTSRHGRINRTVQPTAEEVQRHV